MKPDDPMVTLALEAWEQSSTDHTIVPRFGGESFLVVTARPGARAFTHTHFSTNDEAIDHRRRLIIADMLEAAYPRLYTGPGRTKDKP